VKYNAYASFIMYSRRYTLFNIKTGINDHENMGVELHVDTLLVVLAYPVMQILTEIGFLAVASGFWVQCHTSDPF